MSSTPFHKFIELARLDESIGSLEKQVALSEQTIAKIALQLEEKRSGLDAAHKQQHELIKQRDALDLELASLGAQKDNKERRLETASSPREYSSLQNELQTCNDRIHETEESLVEVWEKIEQAEQDLASAEQAYNDQSKKLLEDQAAQKKEIEAQQQEITTLLDSREAKLVGIPEEWIKNYNAMRDRVANPVVPVSERSCSGCFYQVPAPILTELGRQVFIACPSCHRLLYLG